MSVDKVPFRMFVFGLSLLLSLATVLFFLIRWLLIYQMLWEFIVALILTIICGIFNIFIIVLLISTGMECIKEINYLREIRKEEREKEIKNNEHYCYWK